MTDFLYDDLLLGTGNNAVATKTKNEVPSLAEQQEVLQKVFARRDFLMDLDMTGATPGLDRMCDEAVESGN